ncbi:MAG: cell division protein FtsL [Clostridia bacterium]|nr:cell division protein FtsL [Clostridia bacterium]
MARSKYQYSTSPRKLEPEYAPQKQTKKKKLKVVDDMPRQDVKVSKEQKQRQRQVTLLAIAIFMLLLTISYRNSQINEKFREVKNLKNELSTVQKENEQLRVTIENNINYNNIEKLAKEKLGMQKLTSRQTIYINLPKEDYVESEAEEIVIKEKESWIKNIINKYIK